MLKRRETQLIGGILLILGIAVTALFFGDAQHVALARASVEQTLDQRTAQRCESAMLSEAAELDQEHASPAVERREVLDSDPSDLILQVRCRSRLSNIPADGVRIEAGLAKSKTAANGPLTQNKVKLEDAVLPPSGMCTMRLSNVRRAAPLGDPEFQVIWVHVNEPGFRRTRQTMFLFNAKESMVSLQLSVTRGHTIDILVEDAEGAPVPKARIHRCAVDETGIPTRSITNVRTNELGRYALVLNRLEGFGLFVSKSAKGAVSCVWDPESDSVDEVIVLRLQGNGQVGGVVLGEDNLPLKNFNLLLVPESLADAPRKKTYGFDAVRLQWEGGLQTDYQRTDSRGRFQFGGLAAGQYRVRTMSHTEADWDQLLTFEPIEVGRQDLVLRVQGRYLRLHLVQEDGALFQGPLWRHDEGGTLTKDQPELYWVECSSDGVLIESPSRSRGRMGWPERGVWELDVLPGRSYVVGLVSQERPFVEELIHIPSDTVRTRHELVIGDPVPKTRMRVRVLDLDGKPVHTEHSLSIRSPDSGRVLLRRDSFQENSDFVIPIGPGRYELDLSGSRVRHRTGQREGDYGVIGGSQVVDVRPDRESQFIFELTPGAALQVQVNSELTSDLPEIPSSAPYRQSQLFVADGVQVALESTDGSVFYPEFPYAWFASLEDPNATSSGAYAWIPFQRALRTGRSIPPGEYTIAVHAEGFETLRQAVTLRAGELSEVTMTLTEEHRVSVNEYR